MIIEQIHYLSEMIVFSPLLAAIVAGFGSRYLPRHAVDKIATAAVGFSFLIAVCLFTYALNHPFREVWSLYDWATIGSFRFHVGFWLDPLTILMAVVVTFVSFMVHVYTMGYMADDAGYSRFFSYIALFTFAMLMLVMSDNFLQLFFGWEAVGLVSYLLIGFWYDRPSAVFANLKAFLVNRVGDFGFLLGIALVFWWCNSVDYTVFFDKLAAFSPHSAPLFSLTSKWSVSLLDLMAILLFIGAMGKSAQVPLHVWLPDSMEGPTPISALIHAATMVTAGVFMVARMSPLFECADAARVFVLLIGATTAFFMGWVGVVQNDIKRVIAYSTLSQLGYMVTALGASAYTAAIFHLATHAFFKALLFLGAGSVIMGMHHEQDIRKMGGLYRLMPITYATMLIGTLALVGFPFFAGFYSKDLIIEAVQHADLPGAQVAYWALLSGVFVTSLYSFRLFFLVFHTKPRMDQHTLHHVHESPGVVTIPLVILAFFSVVAGFWGIQNLVFSPHLGSFWQQSIVVSPEHHVMAHLASEFRGAVHMGVHGFLSWPFILLCSGFFVAWAFYVLFPQIPRWIQLNFEPIHTLLNQKYYFDAFNQMVLVRTVHRIGQGLSIWSEQFLIDGCLINGTAKRIADFSEIFRKLQTGYLYHAALLMVLGVLIWVACFLWNMMA